MRLGGLETEINASLLWQRGLKVRPARRQERRYETTRKRHGATPRDAMPLIL